MLDLKGPLIRPKGHKCKHSVLTLSARVGMANERGGGPPTSVGYLSSADELLSAYVSIPAERMAELVAVAASQRFQTAFIVGSRLRYRSGTVHRFHVSTELEEDDEE